MILERALKIIEARKHEYGESSDTFARVASAFNAVTGNKIKPQDVALMQILLKLIRSQTSHGNQDHYVDIAGYAEIMALIADQEVLNG